MPNINAAPYTQQLPVMDNIRELDITKKETVPSIQLFGKQKENTIINTARKMLVISTLIYAM